MANTPASRPVLLRVAIPVSPPAAAATTNLPPAKFKELSIFQLASALQKYPKNEPSPQWQRVRDYANAVHSMYINRFNLNHREFKILQHSFSNYFTGIVNVWIENDESITKCAFIEYLQSILRICPRIRRLRISNKKVNRQTIPADDINKCLKLDTMVFDSCTINEMDLLKYTNLIAVHLLNCQITGDIINGPLKKIRLIQCSCREQKQNQLADLISTRVIAIDQSTKKLKEIDFQEALQIANELPTKDVLLNRPTSSDEFILKMGNFVAQNGPFIGHMTKPLLTLPTTPTPAATQGDQTAGQTKKGGQPQKSQSQTSQSGKTGRNSKSQQNQSQTGQPQKSQSKTSQSGKATKGGQPQKSQSKTSQSGKASGGQPQKSQSKTSQSGKPQQNQTQTSQGGQPPKSQSKTSQSGKATKGGQPQKSQSKTSQSGKSQQNQTQTSQGGQPPKNQSKTSQSGKMAKNSKTQLNLSPKSQPSTLPPVPPPTQLPQPQHGTEDILTYKPLNY